MSKNIGEVTRRKIRLSQLLQEAGQLKAKGQEQYAPKIGRQLKKVNSEIEKLQKIVKPKEDKK